MPSAQQVKSTLAKLGLKPNKALGQHFLLDDRTVDFMVKEAAIKPGDKVLEIGPGLGILTSALARAGAEVVAVEKDPLLTGYLTDQFHNWRNVAVTRQNALFFDFSRLGSYKVVANLPYNIASPLLRKFLEQEPRPNLMVVMVQKEVAERIVAPPGSGERGVLSVMVQFYGEPRMVGHVPRSRFWPQPEVDAAILKIEDLNRPLPPVNPKAFFTLVKAGFGKKRAQLKNALKGGLGLAEPDLSALLAGSGVDPSKRAQELTQEEWLALAKALPNQ